jgi:hypothetical protein
MRQAVQPANDDHPEARWDRGNLAEWRAGLSPQRRAADRKKLARIFNLAAQVPELRDALEWAKDHGIEFIVDRKAKAGGYYTVGTGVVAIVNNSFKDISFAAGVMVHEIRHAWQDWYGMIPTTGKSFTDYFMRLSVIEADAMAHGLLTERQHGYSRYRDHWEKSPPSPRRDRELAWNERRLHDNVGANQYLWSDFTWWYSQHANYYGDNAIKLFGSKLGVPGVQKPDLQQEYDPYKDRRVPKVPGIDVTRYEELRRLGKGFKCGNYFNNASRDLLDRQILVPGSAAAMYAGNRPVALANEIRKRELLLKRHKGKAELL